MGYHLTNIKKGIYGERSKITEEYDELLDALIQNNKILILTECADLLGAACGYYKPDLSDMLRLLSASKGFCPMDLRENPTLERIICLIQGILEDEFFGSIDILDVYRFALLTESAFKDGSRKC